MFDFLSKLKFDWKPEDIVTEPLSDISPISTYNNSDLEELQLAQRVADHLNQILNYQDRIEAIDYLAAQAKTNFDNIIYNTTEESLINAIISIGGPDSGDVDFYLAKDCIDAIIDFMDKSALEGITGQM